jgi:predicted RNase H-like HicB family nuclease
MRQYIALIHKDTGSDYGVSFPDLPGCVTAGVDLDDARRMAEEALALHLAGMAEDDEPIPEPSSLEAVMADRENRDAVAILVKAPPATVKAVRVNMTLPEDELEQIDKFAAEQGYTRSGFLLHAAKTAIDTAEVAKAGLARVKDDFVKADEADPIRRLAELVETSYAAGVVKKAIEAKADPAASLAEALAEFGFVRRPTAQELRRMDAESTARAEARSEAVAKAIDAGLTGPALEKVVHALLRNEVKPDEVEKMIGAELKNGANADEAQRAGNKAI